MKIRIQKGSCLEYDKKEYNSGDEVDVPDKLADALIRGGTAVAADERKKK
ncbi:MAG: hypothetical protein ACREI9_09330 [Nitrospiraceae bacterium]